VSELYRAKVTSKGQVTIPKELREKIGICAGSYIEIKETAAGYVISKHVDENCLTKYVGILRSQGSSDSIIKEMREG
jgi:AbrB family looped-hinge helix DNA binding protein